MNKFEARQEALDWALDAAIENLEGYEDETSQRRLEALKDLKDGGLMADPTAPQILQECDDEDLIKFLARDLLGRLRMQKDTQPAVMAKVHTYLQDVAAEAEKILS